MVFISRGRGRGANRGRGRGVGEVAFEPRPAHNQGVGRDSRQAPESLRITVGNDQFRDRKEDTVSGRLSPTVSQRLGPHKDGYQLHGHEAEYRREDDMYRREAEIYGRSDRERFERERVYDRREQHSRDPYARPEEREYGDRRGLGGGNYEHSPADYHHQPSQPLFPSASRSPPPRFPAAQPVAPSPALASATSRPLKSILKKKSEPVAEEKPSAKTSGLPGIANYMDDIEDEDKFLYGGDDDRDRRGNERDRRDSGQYRQQTHGVTIEDMRLNIRSAAQSWQPSAPEKTVSGVVSEFVNAQREYVDNSKSQHFGGAEPYHSQPMQSLAPVGDSGGNDLWSMLAKSVQTVQQQQQNPPNQYEHQPESYQPPFSAQSTQPSFSAQPAQNAQAPATAHDPTIENILKSIGFDFEMSKRMQEKAKQSSGEVVPQAAKPGDPQFINQTASFIGTQMSHEEMVSQLGPLHRERDAPMNVVERRPEPVQDDFRERELYDDRNRRGSSEASRGRVNSPPRIISSPPRRISSPTRRTNSPQRRTNSPQRRTASPTRRISSPMRRISSPTRRISSPSRMPNSPPSGQIPERLQRGCSPVSAEGSPPPPMFNLPPITIKRRPHLDRSRSPGWEQKRGLSNSPTRDSDRSRNRPRSRSPSWNRSVSSYGRKRSPSPVRKHSVSSRSPRNHSRSPARGISPVIKRTFNLDDLSPAFRRRVSPTIRQRSLSPISPERSTSPGRRRIMSPDRRSISPRRRRSPSRRSISPCRRRSVSPGRRKSRSPGRRRSRSPVRRRSRSPGRRGSRSPVRRRSRSPRRHSPSPRGRRRSLSPRGRKRGLSSRSRSRERKIRRSTSRDRFRRGSPGRSRRSSSRDRNRKRSRSPRKRRSSMSVSSDSDIDGPANKQYFSSPLRLNRDDKQKIPRYYDYPPPQQGPPPDFNAPPFQGYGLPPGSFPPGTQLGVAPIGPPGPPPMMSMPPPGMGPPIGPPVSFPYPPPVPTGPVYAVPGPPNFSQPPPVVQDPDIAPPGTVEMPLNLPSRPNLTEIVSEDKKQNIYQKEPVEDRRRERSRSKEKTKDKREDRRSEKSNSSSNRTVLPPKPRSKAEDIEIKASTTSNERVVVLSGKLSKSSANEKKVDPEKEKAKVLKEKESMVAKIKALETEFNNLKKQEFDLRKRTGKDNKPDPILMENKKLLEEIKKEIVKLTQQKNDFESKHSSILKREQATKREIKVTPKKTPSKDDKSKPGDKKTEKEEFKVEKGKLMKHYFHDGGDHWCKPCNSLHPNIQDYMHHLASYRHKQTLPSDFRPWMDGYKANDGMIINKKGVRVPLPGIEFMMPVTAYYCQLCKVFLGDVSFGADHFKCESHYINYKKYLADNPIYEKKYKEERNKVLSALKATRKVEQEKKAQKAKEDMKQKNTEKDARIRENEKKWDKSVDDLNDVKSSDTKQDTNKTHIKVSLKDQKSENNEKGFGKFNWTKDKKTEEQKNGQKTPEAGQEKEKGKINFNISLSNKTTGKKIIGKTGAAKKNPLLPPWQPVGKKSETFGKPGETASLDQFLTTNTGEGKIPVISEKKKVSAKEILEAFSGKYKDKEIGPSLKKEADSKTATLEKKDITAEEKKENIVKSKKEKEEEEDKRMMGIDPDAEVPLAIKKPPPPVSQNVPLPDHKPSATVDENDVHKIFNSENTGNAETSIKVAEDLTEIPVPDSDKKVTKTLDLKEIPIPEAEENVSETVDLKEIPVPEVKNLIIETEDSKEMPDTKTEKPVIEILDLTEIPVPETEKPAIEILDLTEIPVSETGQPVIEILDLEEIPVPLPEWDDGFQNQDSPDMEEYTKRISTKKTFDKEDSAAIYTETKEDINGPKTDSKFETKSEDVTSVVTSIMETISREVKEDFKVETKPKLDEEKVQTNIEIEIGQAGTELDWVTKTPEADRIDEIEINVSVKAIETPVQMEVEDGESLSLVLEERKQQSKQIGEEVKMNDGALQTAIEQSHKSDEKKECMEEETSKTDTRTDDSATETEEPESPSPLVRGRGRGRGRKRGRGRGKAKTTHVRSTRSTRSTKAVEIQEEDIAELGDTKTDYETIDCTETGNKDSELSDTNKDSKLSVINKDSEFNSSVQIAKTEGVKSKKSTSPRIRKSSVKSDSAKIELEETSDKEDTQSEASGVSMHMDSDFEVVDDLEDMEVLDEAI